MDLTPEEVQAQSGYGKPVTVEFVNDVAVVTMRRGDNRFNYDFVQAMHKAFDEVER